METRGKPREILRGGKRKQMLKRTEEGKKTRLRGTGEEKTILQSETPELLTTLSLSSRCGVVGTPGEGDGTRGCNNLGGSGNKEK